MLLSNALVCATIPVTDIKRARKFYEGSLGLRVAETMDMGALMEVENGGMLYLYERGPSKADHTLASFQVENIEKMIQELTQKGVKFEHYDMPGIKTNGMGIAEQETVKAAWFKDPDGNILGLTEKIE